MTARLMTARLWLRISAVYLGLLGLASLLAPQAAASGLGQPMTPFDIFAARTVGVILIAFAVANWSTGVRPATGTVLANALLNAALAALDTLAILDKTISAGSWGGIAAHLVLLTALLAHLFTARAATGTTAPAVPSKEGA
ncbi:hypothetical protein [Nonomuraea sp. NPDC049784]|uniref:hypothetical protein n=1 Tax=Nonomuraea sp. NPDC049784 TaxID=3154361 RepID=UPI0033DC5846